MRMERKQKTSSESHTGGYEAVLFQCFINSWKQTQQTGGDDIPEAQEARERDMHFVPFFFFYIKCILAKVD